VLERELFLTLALFERAAHHCYLAVPRRLNPLLEHVQLLRRLRDRDARSGARCTWGESSRILRPHDAREHELGERVERRLIECTQPAGTRVRVVRLVGDSTLDVVPALASTTLDERRELRLELVRRSVDRLTRSCDEIGALSFRLRELVTPLSLHFGAWTRVGAAHTVDARLGKPIARDTRESADFPSGNDWCTRLRSGVRTAPASVRDVPLSNCGSGASRPSRVDRRSAVG